uniref:Alcohol dehydrogenase-like N-terminal domain-containing protein n=1 Tax=Chromera velia CCMP2878 TaxID=1169474 RepID=A0A0G4GG61_9ALVE|eukprot:Cvel_21761.t1-p1 / transcript=Cvel_21761.t1 / gene=Cvel_21761 / organism=Chromera_velia_CCMP2878 / gene_product=2-deoxy-scyllo-inosamine dehydrogenase, putative / transcript_product=2-deoxy-scyllo-inosamine dehydrogenase, putative / location=Cvel_scaffold2069:11466-14979(+) / protein_length=373 / sequence_SO=supercontig / SO=protein_coding / is_pseudo=false
MKALTFSEAKGVTVEEKAVPELLSGHALIQVLVGGICSTDIQITKGYVPGYNHTLGHEFIGKVIKCEDSLIVGARVVADINVCDPARKDAYEEPTFWRNHEPNRTVLGIIGRDGAFSEFICLPVRNLHVVPQSIPDKVAVFAEPLAAACRIVEQGLLTRGMKAAVVGIGKLGALVAQVLLSEGKRWGVSSVTAVGKHQATLDMLQETQGEGKPALCKRLLRDLTDNEKAGYFDLVVDTTGTPEGFHLALGMTRPMGTVVLKSTCSTAPSASALKEIPWQVHANDIVVNEKRVIGSRCGPFPLALQLLQKHPEIRQLCEKMVTAEYALSDGVNAVEKAKEKGVLKVLLHALGGGGDGWAVEVGVQAGSNTANGS